MCEECIKEGMVVVKLIKFTQCLGNKALTNDQENFLQCRWGNWFLIQNSTHPGSDPGKMSAAPTHNKSTYCFL